MVELNIASGMFSRKPDTSGDQNDSSSHVLERQEVCSRVVCTSGKGLVSSEWAKEEKKSKKLGRGKKKGAERNMVKRK